MGGQIDAHHGPSALAEDALGVEGTEGRSSLGPAASQSVALLLAAGLFTAAALAAIWSVRFLPMQDYPQHLLQAHIVGAVHADNLDFSSHFDARLRVAPYVTFYAVAAALARVLPIEVAGKLAVSLYVLAVAGMVFQLVLRGGGDALRGRGWGGGWGLLLFFPFMFSQAYYLGMINYLYSLPLLVMALVDHERLGKGPVRWWIWCRQVLWLAALFLTHPFTYLVYVGLALGGACLSVRRPSECLRGLVAPVLAAGFFVVWMLTHDGESMGPGSPKWLSWQENLAFYGYLFTGMRWFDGVDKLSVLVWSGVAVVVGRGLLAARGDGPDRLDRYLLYFALASLAVFVLPFRVKMGNENWHHVNLRLAPLAMFFLAMIVGRLRFTGGWAVALVALVALAMGQSLLKQRRISAEIEQIAPVVEEMAPNAVVLPLVFDHETPQLDAIFFDVHLHDHNYYHLRVGGGVNPYLFSHELMPVQYRPRAVRPAPPSYRPERFTWARHAADYRYLLIRKPAFVSEAYDAFLARLAERTRRVKSSGPWVLLEVR